MRRVLSLLLTPLLLLVLLLSQQAALTHALAHWEPGTPGALAAASEQAFGDERESAAHACGLCVAAAQYAAVLPTSGFQPSPPAASATAPAIAFASPSRAALALPFHSRAPPRA